MEFRNLNDLGKSIANWSTRLPDDLDIIAGIPRSGMLAAVLLAIHMHKPLVDLEGYVAGRSFQGGERTGFARALPERPHKVLIVDDSVSSGNAIRRARMLLPSDSDDEVLFGAVYATDIGQDFVDTFGELVPQPRLFEWNLFNHGLLTEACMDIDGVLCRDPSHQENDDGLRYRRFIETVPARVVPQVRVAHLVSSRAEQYRPETEAWLSAHGIRYGELHLYPGTAAERRERGDHAAYKASIYSSTDAMIFVESDRAQAIEISQTSRRAVIATDTMELFDGRRFRQIVSRIRQSDSVSIRTARKLVHTIRKSH